MIIWQVVEDLGDGDAAIRNFRTEEEACEYIEANLDYCYHESNPHKLEFSNIRFHELTI